MGLSVGTFASAYLKAFRLGQMVLTVAAIPQKVLMFAISKTVAVLKLSGKALKLVRVTIEKIMAQMDPADLKRLGELQGVLADRLHELLEKNAKLLAPDGTGKISATKQKLYELSLKRFAKLNEWFGNTLDAAQLKKLDEALDDVADVDDANKILATGKHIDKVCGSRAPCPFLKEMLGEYSTTYSKKVVKNIYQIASGLDPPTMATLKEVIKRMDDAAGGANITKRLEDVTGQMRKLDPVDKKKLINDLADEGSDDFIGKNLSKESNCR